MQSFTPSLKTVTRCAFQQGRRCIDKTQNIRTFSSHASGRPRVAAKASASRRNFSWGSSSTSGSGQAAWESLDMLPQISGDLAPLFLALLLASREDEDEASSAPVSSSPPSARPFIVQAIPSKGLGAISDRAIKRGEIIISERALLIWPRTLDAAQAQQLVDQLTPSARKAYLSLSNASSPEMKLNSIMGIRATNAFAVELPPLPQKYVTSQLLPKPLPTSASFIFPRIARINHSCVANADHAMNWKDLKMTVYATTDISLGEEICIEYTPSLVQMDREARRAILQRDFGFVCNCGVCGLSGEQQEASDGRRREVNAIVQALSAGGLDRKQMWAALERIETLLDQEGYKAMPEFSNERISNAYVGFKSIKARREAEV